MIKRLLDLLGIKSTNDKLLLALSFLLFLPLLFDFIFAATKGESALYSMLVYGLSLAVIILIGLTEFIAFIITYKSGLK